VRKCAWYREGVGVGDGAEYWGGAKLVNGPTYWGTYAGAANDATGAL